MPLLQQTGDFRGNIMSYGLDEAESGAIAVKMEVSITGIWYDGQWCDYSEHALTVGGYIWIIKKDGKINENSVKSLMNYAGWDGNLESIVNGSWFPKPIACSVEEDTYKDTTRYRIAWVNDFDREPGGGNVDSGKAKDLQQRFGGQLRAIAGNATRNDQKPTGKPGKSSKPAPAPTPAPEPVGPPEDDVPF